MRVLYANSNVIYSSTRVRKLRDLGLEVIFRQNAAEVLEIFAGPKEAWPDILVMDDFLCSGETELVTEHSTNGYTQTGKDIYGILREQQNAIPTLIYTTSRSGYEELGELCVNDSRLIAVYDCTVIATREILAGVQKLAKLIEANTKVTSPSPRKMDLSECRQTCRLKVKIGDAIAVVKVLMAHQRGDGLNERPVGNRVHLVPGGWFDTNRVEVLEVLPWEE